MTAASNASDTERQKHRDAPSLVLASGSPRRRDLLTEAGIDFEIRVSDIPEVALPGESPIEYTTRLAAEKALAVAREIGTDPARWVLGADTIVVLAGDILEKPDDSDHAVELLGRLVGNRHQVVTGFALVCSKTHQQHVSWVESHVSMRDASEQEIRAYVATGEPLDKAGAYAVQGEGARFVSQVEGSLSNVIGLPVEQVLEILQALQNSNEQPE
jgi:septum formation protein